MWLKGEILFTTEIGPVAYQLTENLIMHIMVCFLESGGGLMYCVAYFRLVWQSLHIERKNRPRGYIFHAHLVEHEITTARRKESTVKNKKKKLRCCIFMYHGK